MTKKPSISVVTPQFDRAPGMPAPKSPPATPEAWEALRELTTYELKALGFGLWSEETKLMLFPAEWYPHIPAGFEIRDIVGRTEPFNPGVTDDDIRFGCLAYGVIAR